MPWVKSSAIMHGIAGNSVRIHAVLQSSIPYLQTSHTLTRGWHTRIHVSFYPLNANSGHNSAGGEVAISCRTCWVKHCTKTLHYAKCVRHPAWVQMRNSPSLDYWPMGELRVWRPELLALSNSQSCTFRCHPPAANRGLPLPFTPYLHTFQSSSMKMIILSEMCCSKITDWKPVWFT